MQQHELMSSLKAISDKLRADGNLPEALIITTIMGAIVGNDIKAFVEICNNYNSKRVKELQDLIKAKLN